jgi:phosphopantetheine--protein transferase-like protein
MIVRLTNNTPACVIGYTGLRDLDDEELSLLPDGERQREFGSSGRTRQFRCGRALLRLLLQEVTGKPAADHDIQMEEGGKPFCNDGPGISVTHTSEVVACAVAEHGLVGIDVERAGVRQHVARIADRFFSGQERDWLEGQSPDGFFMLWVIKEAFVKAHGQSIFGGLEKLRCIVDPPRIEASATEGDFRSLSLYRKADTFLALATTETALDDVPTWYWKPRSRKFVTSDEFRLVATT